MFGSRNDKIDLIFALYKDVRTVFRLSDIALLTGQTSFQSLNQKLNYYVRTGKILNPRKGLYAKPGYSAEELACSIYTPSYISLGTVLQQSGIVFQYDSRISAISYLSRTVEVEGRTFLFRKMKGELLVNISGIIRNNNQVNIATPERAFLDMLYLDGETYFDNPGTLKKDSIYKLLPIYQSKALVNRVNKLLSND